MNAKTLLAILLTVELLSGAFLVAFSIQHWNSDYESWHYYTSKSRLVVSITQYPQTVVNQSYAIFATYHTHTDLVYEVSYQIYESNNSSEALQWAMNHSSSVYVSPDWFALPNWHLHPSFYPFGSIFGSTQKLQELPP